MEIIHHKAQKIIVIAMLAMMIMCIAAPVFAAENTGTENNFLSEILNSIMKFFNAIVESLKNLFDKEEEPVVDSPVVNPPVPEKLKLNKTSVSLYVHQTLTLTANKTVTWSSSDSTVATVDNGKVTALKKGKVEIKAKTSTETVKCTINISERSIKIKEDSIVKTDETNALPAFSKEEVLYMINNADVTRTGKRRENLSGQIDNFMYIQENNKVNALFAIAVAIQESSAGQSTAAINKNNWFGIMSGGTLKTYNSAGDSIKGFGKLISNSDYYFKNDKKTIKAKGKVYCNPSSSWITSITSHMNSLYDAL